jgi:hypothetical protein
MWYERYWLRQAKKRELPRKAAQMPNGQQNRRCEGASNQLVTIYTPLYQGLPHKYAVVPAIIGLYVCSASPKH